MTDNQGVAATPPGAREPNPQAVSALRASPPNANPFERWPGYHEQSWAERFAELDRRHSAMMNALEAAIFSASRSKGSA